MPMGDPYGKGGYWMAPPQQQGWGGYEQSGQGQKGGGKKGDGKPPSEKLCFNMRDSRSCHRGANCPYSHDLAKFGLDGTAGGGATTAAVPTGKVIGGVPPKVAPVEQQIGGATLDFLRISGETDSASCQWVERKKVIAAAESTGADHNGVARALWRPILCPPVIYDIMVRVFEKLHPKAHLADGNYLGDDMSIQYAKDFDNRLDGLKITGYKFKEMTVEGEKKDEVNELRVELRSCFNGLAVAIRGEKKEAQRIHPPHADSPITAGRFGGGKSLYSPFTPLERRRRKLPAGLRGSSRRSSTGSVGSSTAYSTTSGGSGISFAARAAQLERARIQEAGMNLKKQRDGWEQRQAAHGQERLAFAGSVFGDSCFDVEDIDEDDIPTEPEMPSGMPTMPTMGGANPAGTGGGVMGAQIPAAIRLEQERLREVAAAAEQAEAQEARGWGLLGELGKIVDAQLTETSKVRVGLSQQGKYDETMPITERYAWMVPTQTIPADQAITISSREMGQLAVRF